MDFKSRPRVELHRHLEGSLRPGTLLDLAQAAGHHSPRPEDFQVLKPMTDLKAVLHSFLSTQKLLSSPAILRRITKEAIEDAASEGIRLLELRYSPTFIQEGHPNLDWRMIHNAILQGAKDCAHLPIGVGFLCIFQRTQPLSVSRQVLDFVQETQNTWIGVDLADNEQDFPARHFQEIFAKTQRLGLPCTIHAGEAQHPSAATNVIDAIRDLGAQRIGHGMQIIHHPEALALVRDCRIPLELCPTSNWITNAIARLEDHPFRQLMQAGIVTTLNSDDPGVFGISLAHEEYLLQQNWKFSDAEIGELYSQAAAASFLPTTVKQKYWDD